MRDALLGRPARDVDLVVDGDPIAAAARLARRLGGTAVTLDADLPVERVVLGRPIAGVRTIDLQPPRGDLAHDLRERDYTANAVAWDPRAPATLIDPLGGTADIRARRLRMVSPANLDADPLRLLRAVRLFAERLLRPDPETATAIRVRAGMVTSAAPERLQYELRLTLASHRAARALRLADTLGLIDPLLPELAEGRGFRQPKEHYYNVLQHQLAAVQALDRLLAPRATGAKARRLRAVTWHPEQGLGPWRRRWAGAADSPGGRRRAILKLATLLHDVAKPRTRGWRPDGRMHFFGHAEQGGKIARAALARLRFSRADQEVVALLVTEHLRPLQLSSGELPTRRAVFRFVRDLSGLEVDALLLSLADHVATVGPRLTPDDLVSHVAYSRWLLDTAEEIAAGTATRKRLLDGGVLMQALGLQPGSEVGRLLRAVEEAWAAGEIGTLDEALTLARRLHEQGEARRGEP